MSLAYLRHTVPYSFNNLTKLNDGEGRSICQTLNQLQKFFLPTLEDQTTEWRYRWCIHTACKKNDALILHHVPKEKLLLTGTKNIELKTLWKQTALETKTQHLYPRGLPFFPSLSKMRIDSPINKIFSATRSGMWLGSISNLNLHSVFWITSSLSSRLWQC